MDHIHLAWQIEVQSFIESYHAHAYELKVKAIDFALHPPYFWTLEQTPFQASYAVCWQLLFWMGTFPVLPLVVFTFVNLFDLQECLVMWLSSMLIIRFWLLIFFIRSVNIINVEKLFKNFTANTMNWFENPRSD